MTTNLTLMRQEGLEALSSKLGAVGTIAFLRQFESGYGDYTEEREEKLKDITLDDIVASVRKRKAEQ